MDINEEARRPVSSLSMAAESEESSNANATKKKAKEKRQKIKKEMEKAIKIPKSLYVNKNYGQTRVAESSHGPGGPNKATEKCNIKTKVGKELLLKCNEKRTQTPLSDCSKEIEEAENAIKVCLSKKKNAKITLKVANHDYIRALNSTTDPSQIANLKIIMKEANEIFKESDLRVKETAKIINKAKSKQQLFLNQQKDITTRAQRGKRGKKTSASGNVENSPTPTVTTKCENLCFNAETFLILDMLSMSPDDREKFLLEVALDRKIIVKDEVTSKLVLHPSIKKYNDLILVTGENTHRVKIGLIEGYKRLGLAATGDLSTTSTVLPAKPNNKRTDENRVPTIYIEDIVNDVILDGLPKEKKPDLTFPKTTSRTRRNNPNYMNEEDFINKLEKHAQKCSQQNLGVVVEAEIRINAKNNCQSFVTYQDGNNDAFIGTRLGRKFAMNGDIVRVFVRDRASASNPIVESMLQEANTSLLNYEVDETAHEDIPVNKENCLDAFVIKIVRQVHNRKCVGTISPIVRSENQNYVIFIPRDMKMQHMKILKKDLPDGVLSGNMRNIGDILYVGQVEYFQNETCFGKIVQTVGKFGELESENTAILLQNNLNMEPYEKRIVDMYSSPLEITPDDFSLREDIRKECVFTIDPLTARDLDDAMSVQVLDNGCFEIGVHISDVTHFLEEDSELDNIVKNRTTSVYLVNEVFHMLPKPLCYKCSLLPGEDKFAFSVFWEIAANGDTISTRFARTIVNSCTQLAYEHAQKIIDHPDEMFTESDFPEILNGYTIEDIISRVKILNSLAENLRAKRFENGALRINRPKLYFELHHETGEPTSFSLQELNTANFLIEEFMLLANQSVADFIYKTYPHIAILRNHQPPLGKSINQVQKKLAQSGIHIDISSSKTIYKSLQDIWNKDKSQTMEIALSNIVSKTMKRATYICTENITDNRDLRHYALSIPIYTHFTSPIRRYPDILVHRLLAAALKYCSSPKREPSELHKIMRTCNEMKYNAKIAGENSADLYFLHYVEKQTSLVVKAVIVEVFKHTFDIILIHTGHSLNITYRKSNGHFVIHLTKTPYVIDVTFDRDNGQKTKPVQLTVFSEIEVVITVKNRKLHAALALPKGCVKNLSEEKENKKNKKDDKPRKKRQHQDCNDSRILNSIDDANCSQNMESNDASASAQCVETPPATVALASEDNLVLDAEENCSKGLMNREKEDADKNNIRKDEKYESAIDAATTEEITKTTELTQNPEL